MKRDALIMLSVVGIGVVVILIVLFTTRSASSLSPSPSTNGKVGDFLGCITGNILAPRGFNPSSCCSTSSDDQICFVETGVCRTNQYCGPGSWSSIGSYCIDNCCSTDKACLSGGKTPSNPLYLRGSFYADNTLAVSQVKQDGTFISLLNDTSTDWTQPREIMVEEFEPTDKLHFVVGNTGGPGGLTGQLEWNKMLVCVSSKNPAFYSDDGPIVDATTIFGNPWGDISNFTSFCWDGLGEWVWTADGCQNCLRSFYWDPSKEVTVYNVYGNNGTMSCQDFCRNDQVHELRTNTSWLSADCINAQFNPTDAPFNQYDPTEGLDWAPPVPDCNFSGSYTDAWGQAATFISPLICTCKRNDTTWPPVNGRFSYHST